jgi:hypothetical protein
LCCPAPKADRDTRDTETKLSQRASFVQRTQHPKLIGTQETETKLSQRAGAVQRAQHPKLVGTDTRRYGECVGQTASNKCVRDRERQAETDRE